MTGTPPRFPQRPGQIRRPFLDLYERARACGLRLGILFWHGRPLALTLDDEQELHLGATIPWDGREDTMFDPVGAAADALAHAGGVA